MTTTTTNTKADARYAVVLSRPHKCDRYLKDDETTWSLDPAEAALTTHDVATLIAADMGGPPMGVYTERV